MARVALIALMPLPVADPQFWIVTAAAVLALLFILRKRIRLRRRGKVEMPCENCAQAPGRPRGLCGRVSGWILKTGKPAGKS